MRTLDLVDGTTRVVIDRDSKLLPKGRGYIYYPMMSADQRLLAFGASRNEHGHFDADFDIFVAPLDPETLAATGTAVRYTFYPGQDRFPDVFLSGMELGRHRGEAPFEVTLHPEAGDPGAADGWRFEWGDGSPGGSEASHRYELPGVYRVTARRGDQELGGAVHVAPGAPPKPLRTDVRAGGRELVVVFDELVDATGAAARLESGAAVAGVARGDRGRDVVVTLVEPLSGADALVLDGVTDRASVPHAMEAARLPVELAELARPERGPRVPVPDGGRAEHRARRRHGARPDLQPDGPRARTPRRPRGAPRRAGLVRGGRPPAGARRSVSRERRADPRGHGLAGAEEPARPRAPSSRSRARGRARTSRSSSTGSTRRSGSAPHARTNGETSEVDFGQLEAGKPNHLLVSYRPGRLVAYQNGVRVLDTDAIQGGFGAWRDGAGIALGADPDGSHDFAGIVEGVALYHRFFEPDEASRKAHAYLDLVAARAKVARVHVKGHFAAASALPTPEQIAPYREALVVYEYAVPAKKRAKLGGDRVRVAHWAILDGEVQPLPHPTAGARVPLVLEPFDEHPRLESTYVSDTLDPAPDVPLFLDVGD